MHPSDLDLLHACGRPALTPDGRLAVVAVGRPDVAGDRYVGGLWAVPTDGGDPRRLTHGHRDGAPAVSPDGRTVAFLRARGDAAPQLHVVALDGGEPVCLTDQPLGAGAPVWSPDGTHLAYAARVPEPGRYGTEDDEGRKVDGDAEPPRLITQPRYRRDDVGFTRDRRTHLFVLAVPEWYVAPGPDLPDLPDLPGTPLQLTDGDVDDEGPVWSPDGTRLAFVSARHAGQETDQRSGSYTVAVSGGEPVQVVGGDRAVAAVQWLPDGRLLVSGEDLGESGQDFVGRPGRLLVTESAVGEELVGLRALTDTETHVEAADPADLVVADGRVLVRELHRGSVRLLAIGVEDGSAEVLLDGPLAVTGQAAVGGTVVVSISTSDRPGDLAVVSAGEPRLLTDTGSALRARGLRPVEDLVAPSGDGHEVHGWVLLPDPAVYGEGPYPVLLTIHGGPYTQYDWAFFDESQVYAGAGYAVVKCNPRGSSGYGLDHGRAIRHAMGGVDAADVLAFLDHALAVEPRLDAARVGVMGGSYGGYMTALLTTRTDRFAGAIVERGYLDATSFVGSSDIGWVFPGEYHGDVDAMRAQSPMTHVDEVSTPTLVIHSEHDWRCPVEQGQRWFTALRANGVPTELLLFPGEGHELSRGGRPRHRVQRFEHVLRWWERHLPVASS